MPLRLVVAEDYDDMSARAAALVKEALARPAVDGAPARTVRITVPTGDTPLGLYARLAADPDAGAALRAAGIYQLDEYLGAGPDDDVPFAVWLRRALVRPAGIPDGRFHRLPADDPEPQLALARFEAELAAAGAWTSPCWGWASTATSASTSPAPRSTRRRVSSACARRR